ncbi:hypothetical protein EP232_00710 [bacterium]|nr:MAG: hypothetical protein EP232_00710 [bacterium]
MHRKAHLFTALILLTALIGCSGSSPRPDSSWQGYTITGILMDESGQPIEGGHVYAYGGSRTNILGPADAMSERTEVDGVYNVVVPGGEYRLVARKRLSGAIGGPLRNGDMVGLKPVTVTTKSPVVSDLDIVMGVFEQGREGDPSKMLKTDTIVTGVILDERGNPVADAHAFAYQGDFRKDPPDFFSPTTGRDGIFTLNLPGSGEYTIGARTGFRGRPLKGDLIGFWDNSRDSRSVVGGKTTSDVNLVLRVYGELDDGS